MTKIFISYRREDSQWPADRLCETLREYVKNPREDVFIDIDNIPLGVDFATYLDGRVSQCDVLLALIGPDWLSIRDAQTGTRRLDDPKDFVRIEVGAALKRGIPVVPVLLDGTSFPPVAELPDDLKELTRRNGVEVRRASFDQDAERLLQGLGLLKIASPKDRARTRGTRARTLLALFALLLLVGGGAGAAFHFGLFRLGMSDQMAADLMQAGNEALAGRPNSGAAQLAIDAFAQVHAERPRDFEAAQALGGANLLMAGLSGPWTGAEFGCSEGRGEATFLEAAVDAFAAAARLAPDLGEPYAGAGCALQALGRRDQAAADFQRAIDAFERRVQSENDPTKKANLHLAIARAQLGGRSSLSDMSDVSQVSRTAALASVSQAMALRPDGEALLLRGKIRLSQGDLGGAREDISRAHDEMGEWQAEASYVDSVIEVRRLEVDANSARRAIVYADQAVSMAAEVREYSYQACRVRVLTGLELSQSSYCRASEALDGPRYPEALLYEGMFWMRMAYDTRLRSMRGDYWGRALVAFESGLERTDEQAGELWERLSYGRRYALYCAGLEAADARRPGDAASEAPREFFQQSGLTQCWRNGG